MSRFHKGQQVVAVASRPCGIVEGHIYTILDILEGFCIHAPSMVDVGIRLEKEAEFSCEKCNTRMDTETWWLGEHLFAPIELSTTTIEELISEEIFA